MSRWVTIPKGIPKPSAQVLHKKIVAASIPWSMNTRLKAGVRHDLNRP